MKWLTKWFRGMSWTARSAKSEPQAVRPALESLEDRQLMSVTGFSLHNDGKLYAQNSNGTSTYLDGGVQAIAQINNSSVFDLHSDGKLYLQNADTSWKYLDGGVQSIAGTGGSSVFDLHSNGDLIRLNADGTGSPRIDYGVQSFAVSATGDIYTLSTLGNLWLFPGGKSAGSRKIDACVASFRLDATGQLQVTHTAFGDRWLKLGGASGPLGWPTTGQYTTHGDPDWAPGLQAVDFERGRMAGVPGSQLSVKYSLDLNDEMKHSWDCGVSSCARLMRWYGNAFYSRDYFEHQVLMYSGDAAGGWQAQYQIGDTPQQYVNLMNMHTNTPMRTDSKVDFHHMCDLVDQGQPVIALIYTGQQQIATSTGGRVAEVVAGLLAGPLGTAVVAADQSAGVIPLLHYVVVNGVDHQTGRIGYIDPAGSQQQWVSYQDFVKVWNWEGQVSTAAKIGLNRAGVHDGTIIYKA
jgi:hypothetical protein